MSATIEIVSTDPEVRMAAARAFASAPADWSVRLSETESGDADVVVHGRDFDGAGGVVFDPDHPQESLGAVAARLRKPVSRAGVVLVVAATGGAGATTLALHLAAAWGPRACYADLAGGGRRRLGMPGDARTWLPSDTECTTSALPVAGGFRVLLAPAPCPEPDRFPVKPALASFDQVVVDAGTGRAFERLLGDARAAVLVTTPTRPAAEAARELLEAHPGTRWAVVCNRVGPGGQIMRRGLEALVGRSLALELPSCPALRDAEDEARLLEGTWRRWSRCVARLARALEAC